MTESFDLALRARATHYPVAIDTQSSVIASLDIETPIEIPGRTALFKPGSYCPPVAHKHQKMVAPICNPPDINGIDTFAGGSSDDASARLASGRIGREFAPESTGRGRNTQYDAPLNPNLLAAGRADSFEDR